MSGRPRRPVGPRRRQAPWEGHGPCPRTWAAGLSSPRSGLPVWGGGRRVHTEGSPRPLGAAGLPHPPGSASSAPRLPGEGVHRSPGQPDSAEPWLRCRHPHRGMENSGPARPPDPPKLPFLPLSKSHPRNFTPDPAGRETDVGRRGGEGGTQIISLRFSQAPCTRDTLGGRPCGGLRLLSSYPERTRSARAKRYEAVGTSARPRGDHSCRQPLLPGGRADLDVGLGGHLLRMTA